MTTIYNEAKALGLSWQWETREVEDCYGIILGEREEFVTYCDKLGELEAHPLDYQDKEKIEQRVLGDQVKWIYLNEIYTEALA